MQKVKVQIPTGWKEVKFSDICKVNQGLQIPISERYKENAVNRKKYITVQYLNGKSNTEYIEDFSDNVVCTSEDILMTRTGSSGIVITGVDGVFHNNFFKINPNNLINRKLLIYNLKSPYIQYKLLKLAGSSTIPDLNHGDFYSIEILLPPTTEQNRIVTVLETWDKSIEKLAQKIATKKSVKKGLMQKLLMGQVRLPGFSEEWVEMKLNRCLKVRHGKSQKEVVDDNGKFPILATGGEMGRSNSFLCNKPSVLIGRKGTINRPQYMDTPFWTVDTLFYTDIFNEFLPKFIFYKFQMINWERYNEGSSIPSLSASTIMLIKMMFPPFREQTAIAAILTTADKEIETLEKKLGLLEDQKKYLLNNLITGRIRVPE